MDEIVGFFTDTFTLGTHYDLPLRIVQAINQLDRVERGELKARLFNEAKRFGQSGFGVQAIRWIENAFMLIEKNSFRLHEVLFSPGQDIPENIAYYINNAKSSIDLCVFTISDEMLGACLRRAHIRGVKIRIITDNNKMRDVGSQIKDLARAGIQIKTDNSRYHMHNKFGIIDGRISFTGSYNWTYTAKAYNQENLLITTNYTIVHRLSDEFELLWGEMFWLRVKQHKDGRLRAMVNIAGCEQEIRPNAQEQRESEMPVSAQNVHYKKDKRNNESAAAQPTNRKAENKEADNHNRNKHRRRKRKNYKRR